MFASFASFAQITSVAVVGEAAGGWPGSPGNPGPTDIHQMTSTDGENWTLSGLTLTTFAPDGGIKFRANNDWTINWGDVAFPSGTGTQGGANIRCIAGTYDVTFNSTTGAYNFSGGTPLPIVKLVGTAVTEPGGLVLNISGPDTFSVSNSTLVAGFAQFEVDGVLYGGTDFPTGSALSSTDLIPVPGAFFNSISINIASGEYTFIQNLPVSIVGDGVGGWPDSPGNPGPIDINQLSSTNGVNYKLDNLVCVVGPAKFRQNNSWTTNWGNAAFPSGIATQGGDDIAITTAGTYDVKFNRVTGEYSFTPPPTIALVGAATPTGWPTGTSGEIDASVLNTTDGVTYTLTNISLTAGPCKFRANNSWDVNWGAADFPSGIATQAGADIAIAIAGNYSVTLNRVTGAYSFTFLDAHARVQVIHNSPDLAAAQVDVYINGELSLDNFAFRKATQFLSLPSDVSISIDIKASDSNGNSSSPVLYNLPTTLQTSDTYIIVANGIVSATGYTNPNSFGLSVFAQGREASSDPAKTDVLVNHGSPDAPTVDVVETSVPAGTIVDDISFPSFAGYLELPNLDFTLDVRDATGATTVASYLAPLQTLNLDGAAITVLASGFLNPVANSNGPAFGLWVATATGGNLIALPTAPLSVDQFDRNEVQVYPNPSNTTININIPFAFDNAKATLYDLNGRKIIDNISTNLPIDVSGISKGVYILAIDVDNIIINRKIVIGQ